MGARRRVRLLASIAVAASWLLQTPAEAQYFGRNKVIWETFEFETVDTDHFRIYSYPPGTVATDDVVRLSERWYERLSFAFDHEFENRNPLIIYQDHADFQQTLTTSGLIGEGIGGFTESLQNRVVLPLTGINADNDHVIGHELVHAFQFDILKSAPATPGPSSGQQQQLPQWLVEGLAEYLSQGRDDPQTAMWMRDAVLHDGLPDPDRPQRLTLSPYQYGQAIWAYAAGRWGDRAALRMFALALNTGVDGAMRQVLGVEPEAFFQDFHDSLRAAYQPVLDARRGAQEVAEPLLGVGERGARLNIAPSLSPDGTRIAFLSTRELFTIDLFLADAATGEVLEKLSGAESDPHFDNLSFIDSSVAWSPDGRRLAFTVFSRGDRQIALFDVEQRRVERTLALPGLKGISDPAWSPDGRRLVFSATIDRASDLYVIDIDTGALTRLTVDPYTAIQPAFAPDGATIVFVTDRGPETDLDTLRFGPLQLALLNLETRETTPLPIFPHGKHIDPHFSSDGRSLYFIGEPDGVPDIFRYDLEPRATQRLTALKTGVSGITAVSPALSVAEPGNTLAFSVLEDGRFNIYRLDSARQAALDEPAAGEAAAMLPPALADPRISLVQNYLAAPSPAGEGWAAALRSPYEPHLELAYVGPATLGVGVSSYGVGLAGALSAYFTDPLGTRQVATTLSGGTSSGYLGFEDTLGGDIVYMDQKRRQQWGALASRVPYVTSATFLSSGLVDVGGSPMPADIVDTVVDVVTMTEASVFAQHPFTLNRRVEASLGASHMGFERALERLVVPAAAAPYWEYSDLESPAGLDLQKASLAYVVDTAYFGYISPLRGRRWRMEYEWTTGDLDFQTTLLDYRNYIFRKPLTYAFRVLHLGRRGPDSEDPRLAPLDIGRNTLVRGYELGSIDVSECTFVPGSNSCPEFDRLYGSRIAVLNFELRIPVFGSEDFGLFRAPSFPTEAVVFVDAGAAWNADEPVEFSFEKDTVKRVPVVSAGIAARVVVGGLFPIQIYYAVPFQRPEERGVWGFLIATGW